MKIKILLYCAILSVTFSKCNFSSDTQSEAPVLSVEESIKDFEIEKGFVIEPVCTEPLLEDPVAICFDEEASMWVVEMRGYMQDTEGGGEDQPLGRIKILKDNNEDGIYDHQDIFLDSLVMPRAVNVVKNGILLIVPPALYFVENINGKPGEKIVIDSAFAETGNVEHQPNGLLRGIDNWYYCSKSAKRVRYLNGKWVVENTLRRGQWGISMDDLGRLYYNDNSIMLMTDNFLPGSFPVNKNYRTVSRKVSGISIASNHVYPRRATTGVNRGYEKGVLDTAERLVSVTAACGPVIYRGDNYPAEYRENAFVMEPAAYLVKRILLTKDKNGFIQGKFAYDEKEFLTATDERFRPVNAFNSPDGCLYIIDMHRGIIQHTTYMTPYLRKHIDSLKLDRPIGMGRIYRIRWEKNNTSKVEKLKNSNINELVGFLSHPNGYYRDMAQKILVDRGDSSAGNALWKLFSSNNDQVSRLHILWTLEGLNLLTPEKVFEIASTTDQSFIYYSCLEILSQFSDQEKSLGLLLKLGRENDYTGTIYFINSLSHFVKNYYNKVQPYILDAITVYPNDSLIADAIVSSLENKESLFLKSLGKASADTLIAKRLARAIQNSKLPDENTSIAHLSNKEKESYREGRSLFAKYCSACHGPDGQGLPNLAPPLAGSEWVLSGNIEVPVKIVLDGLTGPVTVNGKLYTPDEYPNNMPAIRNNIETNNGMIADILTYIRNSFGNKSTAISTEEVGRVRAIEPGRTVPHTSEELFPELNK